MARRTECTFAHSVHRYVTQNGVFVKFYRKQWYGELYIPHNQTVLMDKIRCVLGRSTPNLAHGFNLTQGVFRRLGNVEVKVGENSHRLSSTAVDTGAIAVSDNEGAVGADSLRLEDVGS